jgi:hypothetical protein
LLHPVIHQPVSELLAECDLQGIQRFAPAEGNCNQDF